MKKTKEIEYIFDIIVNDLNMVLFNDNLNTLMDFKNKCYAALDKSKLINMFHKNTLSAYDNSLRLFANILFEKIPTDRGFKLETLPEFEEFQYWFGSLEFDDFILICFLLQDEKFLKIDNIEELQFIINVYITNRELSYVQPNKNN
jgi:hypothetical protein